eukprot:m.153026 g.153026  ORF g.153026 m.153026 type:complete len:304 (+) comp38614_c0_seq6:96-1007(+)
MKDLTDTQRKARRLIKNRKKGIRVATHWDEKMKRKVSRVMTGCGKIWLKESNVDAAIEYFYYHQKGGNAKTVHKLVSQKYAGISVGKIHDWLRQSSFHCNKCPDFSNMAPLKPIVANAPMERNQIDLVDLKHYLVTKDGKTYRYVMAVLDVFSRFLVLRPLQKKSASDIAVLLLDIYSLMGTPKILQSDQGTEFKGAVRMVMTNFNVAIVTSSPYHPQSQGKLERSHCLWKAMIRHDLQKEHGYVDWVEQLPVYQRLYNTRPHAAFQGKLTPFEVFYGRKSNLVETVTLHDESSTFQKEDKPP